MQPLLRHDPKYFHRQENLPNVTYDLQFVLHYDLQLSKRTFLKKAASRGTFAQYYNYLQKQIKNILKEIANSLLPCLPTSVYYTSLQPVEGVICL